MILILVAILILAVGVHFFMGPSNLLNQENHVTHHGKHNKNRSSDDYMVTHTDRVPNFAKKFTVKNIRNGRWFDPSIWSTGEIPKENEIVQIAEGTRVLYDQQSDTKVDSIGVEGKLVFAHDKNTRLRVTNLLVYSEGSLRIGTKKKPILAGVLAELIFNDRALDIGSVQVPGTDPFQYGVGMLVWGHISIHGQPKSTPFVRLSDAPEKGSIELKTIWIPDDWNVGDQIFVPDSRQASLDEVISYQALPVKENFQAKAIPHWEIVQISAVNDERLILSTPLVYDHPGAKLVTDLQDMLEPNRFLPHVANLSRNVLIRSENPNGTRGHTVCFTNARVSIANAQFKDLGRTTIEKLVNTTIDAEGVINTIGKKRIARYPLHMHHLVLPNNVNDNRPQFEIVGNVVNGGLRWGLVVHSSHFGLIKDNVVVRLDGAGIVTEDGSETGNRFEKNFVSAVTGSGEEPDARQDHEGLGHEGAGFWFGSDNNIVTNNVAVGMKDSGYSLFRMDSSLEIPQFLNLQDWSKTIYRDQDRPRIFTFQNNEVYGSAGSGVRLWSTKKCSFCRKEVVPIKDTVAWHNFTGLTFDYHSDYFDIVNLVAVGDSNNKSTTGVVANRSRRAVIKNVSIVGMGTGIEGGGSRNRSLKIIDATIEADTGIKILRSTSWTGMQPLVIKDVEFKDASKPDSIKKSRKRISLEDKTYSGRKIKRAQYRPIYVYNLNGEEGNDVEIFQLEQAPDFRIPYNADPLVGCPEEGLTNSQCWHKHRVALGGALARCDKQLAGIDGFACPLL